MDPQEEQQIICRQEEQQRVWQQELDEENMAAVLTSLTIFLPIHQEMRAAQRVHLIRAGRIKVFNARLRWLDRRFIELRQHQFTPYVDRLTETVRTSSSASVLKWFFENSVHQPSDFLLSNLKPYEGGLECAILLPEEGKIIEFRRLLVQIQGLIIRDKPLNEFTMTIMACMARLPYSGTPCPNILQSPCDVFCETHHRIVNDLHRVISLMMLNASSEIALAEDRLSMFEVMLGPPVLLPKLPSYKEACNDNDHHYHPVGDPRLLTDADESGSLQSDREDEHDSSDNYVRGEAAQFTDIDEASDSLRSEWEVLYETSDTENIGGESEHESESLTSTDAGRDHLDGWTTDTADMWRFY